MRSRWYKADEIVNAISIASLCSAAYLAVYFTRNILGAITPQMLEEGYSAEFIGRVSSFHFVSYAAGQLIHGAIGDRVSARYMICTGLFLACLTNLLFGFFVDVSPAAAMAAYGLMGFFLAMIYGPMTKLTAENTKPLYATRCCLAYTFSSYFGSPAAGIAAALLTWEGVLISGSAFLGVMAACCFVVFRIMERQGIIKYGQYVRKKEQGGGVRILIQHGIVRFTLISMITGIVRTTVVFWMPTYIAQFLGFPAETAALIFTAATLAISATAFITVFLYEKLFKENMERTIRFMFCLASAFFLLLAAVKQPIVNIICMILGIMASNGASCMLWNKYCPSLRDTGMVSCAVGFLDFASYLAAAVSSVLFADAINTIGWRRLILIWFLLMVMGEIISLPYKKVINKSMPNERRKGEA